MSGTRSGVFDDRPGASVRPEQLRPDPQRGIPRPGAEGQRQRICLFLTIWSYEYGYPSGRVFRRDFDLRALTLTDEQRYTEQIMHYLSNPYYNPDGTERILGGLPENYVPYEWQQPMSRSNFTSMERNRRPLQMVSGVQNA